MISFFVAGIPVPKGSAKAFHHKQSGKIIVHQDNRDKQRPWVSAIAFEAGVRGTSTLTRGPLKVTMDFAMPRVKSHFGTGKNADKLKESAPCYHTSKPDLDKLCRCVKDALTGVIWNDDSQVAILWARKSYGDKPGVEITIEAI
jgi:Holliday junction resolvase RusA-like endonuclease